MFIGTKMQQEDSSAPALVGAPNKKFGMGALLFGSAFAFVLGWAAALAQQMQSAKAHTPDGVVASAGSSVSVSNTAALANGADVLARFQAIDWSADQPAGAEPLVPALATHAPLRAAALQRYRQESAAKAKGNLQQFLMAQPVPEIVAEALAWAQQPDSAPARADGFSLLAAAPLQPQTQRVVRQALDHEKDPVVLGAAIWSLTPLGIPAPSDVQQVVPRLHALTRHSVSDVRAASIQKLAEWDRANRFFEQDAVRLLADPVEDVRTAAIGATSIAALSSKPVKRQLFNLLDKSSGQSDELRSIVLANLSRFDLSEEEYAVYQKVERDIFGDKNKGDSAAP